MGVKKFIQNVLESLNMESFEILGKKKSLKKLLQKLKKRRVQILSELEFETNQEKRELIKEELKLISLHIKKGKEKLNELKTS